MPYKRTDFIPYSTDSSRTIANLEAAYEQWVDAHRALARLPSTMYWQTKGETEYLAVKRHTNSPGTTLGPRSPETETQLAHHVEEKSSLKEQVRRSDELIQERAALCRVQRVQSIPDRQSGILRELDKHEVLRNDVMVVGTNAFIAYSIACQARFPTGIEETEDFDLAWCRDTSVSLARRAGNEPRNRPSVLGVLRDFDSSFTINPRKPYQAINRDGYEVELLAAPSLAPLPKEEAFSPMVTLDEQEWLLKGRPLSVVAPTLRGRACPLYVPDPRWMALHKLWLSKKPERNAAKKPKDGRQGDVLLSACRYFLADMYPMDLDFVFDLPSELRDIFTAWCEVNEFNVDDPGAVPSFDVTPPQPTRRRL
jgi:hypothetical protein